MCVLGKRLLKDIALDQCDKSIKNGTLYNIFCNSTGHCDPYYAGKTIFAVSVVIDAFAEKKMYSFFSDPNNNASIVTGIKGLASGVFFDNLGNSFLEVRTIDGRSNIYCNIDLSTPHMPISIQNHHSFSLNSRNSNILRTEKSHAILNV